MVTGADFNVTFCDICASGGSAACPILSNISKNGSLCCELAYCDLMKVILLSATTGSSVILPGCNGYNCTFRIVYTLYSRPLYFSIPEEFLLFNSSSLT